MPKTASSERHEPFQEWLKDVTNEKTKRYIQERVIKQMDWYRSKSNICKVKYQRWTILSIILSGAIPIASVFANGELFMKVLIAALGAMITGISAYLSLQNYNKLWNIYRSNRELLLSTLYMYFNNTGIFGQETDQDKRDTILIETCEKYFQQEVLDWKSIAK